MDSKNVDDDWRTVLGSDATKDEIGEWLAKKWMSTEPLTDTEMAQARRFCELHGWLKPGVDGES